MTRKKCNCSRLPAAAGNLLEWAFSGQAIALVGRNALFFLSETRLDFRRLLRFDKNKMKMARKPKKTWK